MKKRAVIYARVSTEEQAEHGYSLASQLEACRAYAEANGLQVAAEHTDETSGARLARAGLDAVRAAVDQAEAEAVIVYTADRLSRNLAHSLILREEWQKAGVELHHVDRGPSQDTAEGRLMQNIEAVIAEYEREKIRERTRRGRIAKAKAGKWVGAGNVPYGFRKIGQGPEARLEINRSEAAVIRRIYEMYLGAGGRQPLTLEGIALALTAEGVPPPNRGKGNGRGWYKFTIGRILHRRTNIGEFLFCGHTIRLPELALIDRSLWQAARKRSETNRLRAKRNRRRDYLLTGHLKCSCGRSLTGKAGGAPRRYTYYACRGSVDWHFLNCREPMIQSPAADAVVWEWVYALTDDANLEKGIREWRERGEAEIGQRRQRLAAVAAQIEKAERKLKRLAADYAEALDAEDEGQALAFKGQLQAAGRQRETQVAEQAALIADLQRIELSPDKEARIRETLRAIRARIDGATVAQKREVLDLLDFGGRLEYRDGRRGLSCACHLHIEPEFVSIAECSSPSSSRRTTRKSAYRPPWPP